VLTSASVPFGYLAGVLGAAPSFTVLEAVVLAGVTTLLSWIPPLTDRHFRLFGFSIGLAIRIALSEQPGSKNGFFGIDQIVLVDGSLSSHHLCRFDDVVAVFGEGLRNGIQSVIPRWLLIELFRLGPRHQLRSFLNMARLYNMVAPDGTAPSFPA
jgi:hypothetical protein